MIFNVCCDQIYYKLEIVYVAREKIWPFRLTFSYDMAICSIKTTYGRKKKLKSNTSLSLNNKNMSFSILNNFIALYSCVYSVFEINSNRVPCVRLL